MLEYYIVIRLLNKFTKKCTVASAVKIELNQKMTSKNSTKKKRRWDINIHDALIYAKIIKN